jgi:hypothetical protein
MTTTHEPGHAKLLELAKTAWEAHPDPADQVARRTHLTTSLQADPAYAALFLAASPDDMNKFAKRIDLVSCPTNTG